VVAPYKHLVEQWAEECIKNGLRTIACSSDHSGWDVDLSHIRSWFSGSSNEIAIVVCTYDTFRTNRFMNQISRVRARKVLLADEVHHIGAQCNQVPLDGYDYRLGLSATPRRTYDEAGTDWLLNNVGPIVYKYDIAQAIPKYLCPYQYEIHSVVLSDIERHEYIAVMEEISKLCARGGNLNEEDPNSNVRLGPLLGKRHDIIGSAEGKLSVLQHIMSEKIQTEGRSSAKFTLIYASSGLFDKVIYQLSMHHGLRLSKFTFEETRDERRFILDQFSRGNVQSIIAKKCLDEGMDIPATRTAIILASSSNPMEFIQRRGRVLRRFPGKEYAVIHDVIVLPSDRGALNEYDAKLMQRELRRAHEFARTSRNSAKAQALLYDIAKQYGIYHL